ncbi:MAG: DUF4198 domain-containing protein [Paraglaciecola sp.]|nr:DUF4198 domain-containing protein [Paraglaciecola sp.]
MLKHGILLGSIFLSTACLGHTPYLKPLSFEPSRSGIVTLDASFAEKFFVPDVAFANSIYLVSKPDGKTTTPDYISQLKTRVVVEHKLEDVGTYRFSTGKRLGKVFKSYELDGKRHSMKNPAEPIPKGAKLLSFFQSLTLAETYVSKGAPNDVVFSAYNTGLEFVPVSHPNDLFVNETFEFTSLFDGKPVDGLKVQVFLAKDQFTDEKPTFELISNAQGGLSFTPSVAGTYLLLARHRTDAPASSVAPQISNTYTLVIEAVE